MEVRRRVAQALALAVLVALSGPAWAGATVTQPSGAVHPLTANIGETDLNAYFAGLGDPVDWQADTEARLGAFFPSATGSVKLGLREANLTWAIAWYNTTPGRTVVPTAAELHTLIAAGAAVDTTANATVIRNDPAWTGGYVGLAIMDDGGPNFSQRQLNVVCTGCPTPAPWITGILYASRSTPNRQYLAFEDNHPSTFSFLNDGDFNDDVLVLDDMPRPAECEDALDDDSDTHTDTDDRGCYTAAGGTYNVADDVESDDPPLPAVTLPATPVVGTITATITEAGTGASDCVIEVDADDNGSFERALPTTLGTGVCTAAAPSDLAAGDYDIRATYEETFGTNATATGTYRERPQCANADADDDGDTHADADDRGCYSGAGGTFSSSDDDESDDPPLPAVTLPGTPIVGTITATITEAGTGVGSCVIEVDADGNGSFERALPTTVGAGICTAAAPSDLGAGDYDIRATYVETFDTSTTATGTYRERPQCANADADDDGDTHADADDRGCYSGAGGAYSNSDDDESDDPPLPVVTLPGTPVVGTITATITEAGTGASACVIEVDADDNGSFERALPTTIGIGGCTAAAPSDLTPGDYDIRVTYDETFGTTTTATGSYRERPQCANADADDDGDGTADGTDRGCYSGAGGGYSPSDDSEAGDPAMPAVSVVLDGDRAVATVTDAGTGFASCALAIDRDADGSAETALATTVLAGPPVRCQADVPTDLAPGDHLIRVTVTETATATATATTTRSVAQPPAQPAPPATPAASIPTPLPLACSGRQVQLFDVGERGTKVRLLGLTLATNAGKTVTLRATPGGVVGTAKVAADGSFEALVKRPSKSTRSKVRYAAVVDGKTSSNLKLVRAFTLTSQKGGRVSFRITGKLPKGTRIELRRELTCTTSNVVKRLALPASGRLTLNLDVPPAGTQFAFYRARTIPPKGKGRGQTYTLPILVRR